MFRMSIITGVQLVGAVNVRISRLVKGVFDDRKRAVTEKCLDFSIMA